MRFTITCQLSVPRTSKRIVHTSVSGAAGSSQAKDGEGEVELVATSCGNKKFIL